MIDTKKLNKWAKEIHDNAIAQGWHEEKHSPEHWLSLIMCEVAEAIEADRKGKHADTDKMKKEMDKIHAANVYSPNSNFCSAAFFANYNSYIKSSVEEEFADIVIRLLDMTYEIYGQVAFDVFTNASVYGFDPDKGFAESAYSFVRCNIGVPVFDIVGSIEYMFAWAEHLGIDLDQHIEWKMKYNETRPYKHGGKKN